LLGVVEQSPDERLWRRAIVMRTFWLTVAGLCVVAGVVLLVAAITAGEGSAAIGIGILLLLVAVPALLTNIWIMRWVRAERAARSARIDSSN
jgi:hypothetical protein